MTNQTLPSTINLHQKVYSLKDFDLKTARFSKYEQLILEARKDDKMFCTESDDNKRVFVDSLLISGSALVGCELPRTDFFADFIFNEFSFFLESLADPYISLSEILLALRLNSVRDMRYPSGDYCEPIPFSGKFFHVSFFAAVISRYMTIRIGLNGKIINLLGGY